MPKHPTGQQIQAHLADDLRFVYLLTFDSFAVDAGDVVTASENRINNRYARELLAVLTKANLLSIQDVNSEQDVWQVANPGTYDDTNRTDAEAVIDAWLKQHDLTVATAKVPAPAKEKSVTANPSTTEFKHCLCGCEENIPPKSWYRPGHDARHAGHVGRAIAANQATPGFDRRTLLDVLPTDALKRKAEDIAETAIRKAVAKAARDAELGKKTPPPAPKAEPFVEGKIKIGRKRFPARQYEGGVIEVCENQDGTGRWFEPDLTPGQIGSFTPVITEPVDTTKQA